MGLVLLNVKRKRGNVEEMLSDVEKHLKVTERYVVTRYTLATPYHRLEAELKTIKGEPLPGGIGTMHHSPLAYIEHKVTPRHLVPDASLLLYRVQRRWKGKWVTTHYLVAEVSLAPDE